MPNHCFCINCGSSSIKFALYLLGTHEELILQGAAEHIGSSFKKGRHTPLRISWPLL